MPGWQVAQMWLGGLESHLVAEALRVLMHINEMDAIKVQQVFHFVGISFYKIQSDNIH